MSKPIMEVAIRQVKAGQEDAFVEARRNFVKLLKTQNGIEEDWEFESFFTMPTPNESDVFVGMTRYESMETFAKISEKLMGAAEAQAFFDTFDMLSFVQVLPADGGTFKLEDIITNSEQVLEVAVRKPKDGQEDQFDAARKGFFDAVAEQPGYIMDREFIDQQSGDKVVFIAWESRADFENALGVLQTKPEMGAFFGIVEAKAYQAVQLTRND